jgi:hypothetical protein
VNILRNILAGLCALVFIVTGVASMLLFNLDQKAFDSDTYQQVLANENFYQRLPTIIAKGLVASPQKDELPRTMQGLTVENWENFIRDLLPPEVLQSMGEQALDSLFAYINSESNNAGISLTPLKESMAGEAGTQAVLDLMKTQPKCTLEQVAQITVAALSENEIMLCNPPPEALPLIAPVIKGQLQFAAAVIPDQATFARTDPLSKDEDPRKGLRVLRLFMSLSPLVPLGTLLALSLLAVKSLRDWLAWWGIPITITGIFAVLVSLLGAPFFGLLILRFLIRNQTDYIPPVFLDSGSQLAAAIVEQLLKPTLLQGLALAGAGTILFVGAILLKRFVPSGPGKDTIAEGS